MNEIQLNEEQFKKLVEIFKKDEISRSTSEKDFIDEMKKVCEKDKDSNELFKVLSSDNSSELTKFREYKKYLEKKSELTKNADMKKKISQVYGIDITKINHRRLSDGTEVFMFYDLELTRPVVLENVNEETLTKMLQEKQKSNKNFQSSNNEKNTNRMLKEERLKDNIELQLVNINELSKYQHIINMLDPDQKQAFDSLISRKNEFHLEYVNIEHAFGVSSSRFDSKLYEAVLDKTLGKYTIEEPQTLEYAKKELNNKSNESKTTNNLAPNNIKNEELQFGTNYPGLDIVIEDSEYQDIPKLLSEEIKGNYNIEEFKDNMKKYINQPYLLNNLPIEERKKWKYYIDLFIKRLKAFRIAKKQNQKQNQKNKLKTRQYIPNKPKQEPKAGYIKSIVLIFVILVIGVMLSMFMIL